MPDDFQGMHILAGNLLYKLSLTMRAISGLLLASFLAVCLAPAHSQTAAASSTSAVSNNDPVNKFAGEPFVILHRDTVNVMHADGTGYRESTLAIRLQSEAALRQFGVINVPYASGSADAEFHYARVRRPDGSVIETPGSDAVDQPAQVTREAPFYSDLKEKQLPVRSLHVGDTLEWQARITVTKPEVQGQFWGQDTFLSEGIALAESEELHVPAGIHVTVWTNPKDITKPVETTSATEHIYRWTHANLKPTVGKDADAETAARQALEKLEAETGSWTLDEAPRTLTQQSSLLVATWDTMGWILFREGKLSDAKDLVSAAWHNSPNSEVADHLRTISLALHDPGSAAVTHKGEQEIRTFPLGPSKGRHGTAEVRLLLGDGKIVRVENAAPENPQSDRKGAGKVETPGVPDAAELLKAANLRALFPAGHDGQLVRNGFVNCSGSLCQLILTPMSAS